MDAANGKSFDASALMMDDDATTEVEIYHPKDGQPTGIVVKVLSNESRKAKELQRQLTDRRLSRMQRRGGKNITSSAEIEADTNALRVALTVGWHGVLWNGEPLEFTPENVAMLYDKAPPIRNQVDQAIADITLFTRA